MLLILIAPWPEGVWLIWLVLLTLVVFQCVRSQKRIAAVQGELRLLADRRFCWHGRELMLAKKPWMPGYGMLLTLQPMEGKTCCRLWLASDSMGKKEWRHLHQLLLYPSADGDEDAQ